MKYFADLVSFSGLALLGYGLFLFSPWVSYSVVGALLIVAGVFLGRNEAVERDKG